MRQREVFSTEQIAHLWAHQTQKSARNPQGNFSFAALGLRSYSAVIARIVRNKRGETAVLHSTQSWSSTTNKHQWAAKLATRHMPCFTVAEVVNSAADYYADYKGRIAAQTLLVAKARQRKEEEYGRLVALTKQANDCLAFFSDRRRFKAPAALEELAPALDKLRKADAKRSAEERRQEEAHRLQREALEAQRRQERIAHALEDLPLWLVGDSGVNGYDIRTYLPGSYLRINPADSAEVQTTLGAVVPLEHVRRIMPLVLRLLASGRTYKRNGHSIHVGHYVLDEITADGTVIVGCHRFERSEVERFAAVLAITPAADDSQLVASAAE